MNRLDPIPLIQIESYETAKEKGWHEEPDKTVGEAIALMHSELSEALEEYRNNPNNEIYTVRGKPEGIGIELADCVIRILDFCGQHQIDLADCMVKKMAYNKTRAHRHGGKRL